MGFESWLRATLKIEQVYYADVAGGIRLVYSAYEVKGAHKRADTAATGELAQQ